MKERVVAALTAGLILAFLFAFNTALGLIHARFRNVERILSLEHERANLLEEEIAELQGAVLLLEAGEE